MEIIGAILIILIFVTVQRALYRRYRRKIAEKPERKTVVTLGWIVASLIGVPFLLFTIYIFSDKSGLIAVTLLFGWIPALWVNTVALVQQWEMIVKVGTIAVLLLTVFHWSMQWRFRNGPFKHNKQLWKVRWTAGLAGAAVLVMISGFASMGVGRHLDGFFKSPLIRHTCARSYDSDTKSNLHNVYLACKAYWVDYGPNNPCNDEIARQTNYGYIQSPNVQIDATGGEIDFRAVATNIKNGHWFWMDEMGTIEPLNLPGRKS